VKGGGATEAAPPLQATPFLSLVRAAYFANWTAETGWRCLDIYDCNRQIRLVPDKPCSVVVPIVSLRISRVASRRIERPAIAIHAKAVASCLR